MHIYDCLGAHFNPACTLQIRAARQITKQQSALTPLKTTRLKNRNLRHDNKVGLVDTFANCNLFYQSETSDSLPFTVLHSLDTACNQPYRTAARSRYLHDPQHAINDERLNVIANHVEYTHFDHAG